MSEDLAWAAGFFEGEGCICIYETSGKKRVKLSMPQSGDRRLLDKFLRIVEAGSIVGPYLFASQTLAKKPRHIYQAYGRNVWTVLDALEPYMDGPKLDKLREAREATSDNERRGAPSTSKCAPV